MGLIAIKQRSKILEQQKNINILVSDKFNRDEKYNVIWFLHGLGDDGSGWIRKTNIENIVNRYNVIVVFPDMGRTIYSDLNNGPKYFSYLTKELMPFINKLFSLTLSSERTFLIGNSMGGFGAIKLISKLPNNFSKIYVISTLIDPTDLRALMPDYTLIFNNSNLEYNSLMKFIESSDLNRLKKIKWFSVIGTDDSFLKKNERFRDEIKEEFGIQVEMNIYDGFHDWDFWNKVVSEVFEKIMEK